MADTRILPSGLAPEAYPDDAALRRVLAPYRLVQVDPLQQAVELGDPTGRIANVILLGLLSALEPFDRFPAALWHQALHRVAPKPVVWAANYAAFEAGRTASGCLAGA
jgi:indolepyruvate ferredoxin oxidoreductase alpha subunit